MFIVFSKTIVDMLSNNELKPIVTDLLIREKKLKIFPVFITQSYIAVPKNIRLDSAYCFVIKFLIPQIAFDDSSDTDLQDFMNLYKNLTVKRYFFMVIDITLASENCI